MLHHHHDGKHHDELNSKWNPHGQNAIRKIANDNNNKVNCNELIGKKRTNCDQWSPMNKQQQSMKKLDDAKKKLENYGPNANVIKSTLANNCVKSGSVNEIS